MRSLDVLLPKGIIVVFSAHFVLLFDDAVDSRCSSMLAFAEEMVAALRSEFHAQLQKMPKKVRTVSFS
jgi:hypothetical protein